MSWHTPVHGSGFRPNDSDPNAANVSPDAARNAANALRRPIGNVRLVNISRLISAAPAPQRSRNDGGDGTAMDEYDAVSVNVAAKLKNMNPTQRIYAELLLNKVLTYGMLCTLSETSDVVDVRYSAEDGTPSDVRKRR